MLRRNRSERKMPQLGHLLQASGCLGGGVATLRRHGEHPPMFDLPF